MEKQKLPPWIYADNGALCVDTSNAEWRKGFMELVERGMKADLTGKRKLSTPPSQDPYRLERPVEGGFVGKEMGSQGLPSPPSTDKSAEEFFNDLNNNRAIKWEGLSDGGKWTRAIEAMQSHALNVGREQYNQAINDVMKLTYEQTLESGSVVDVIEVTELIKLKKP